MSTATILVPRLPAAPRGAQLVALIYDVLSRASAYVQDRLDARHQRTLALEARAVRRLADELEASDPGMAADLRAAADRHTGGL